MAPTTPALSKMRSRLEMCCRRASLSGNHLRPRLDRPHEDGEPCAQRCLREIRLPSTSIRNE
jgi:hypothetical protein